MAKLLWRKAAQLQEKILPQRGFVTLGSGPDNTLVLIDPQINRHHARLVAGPHGYLLKDLHSTHGVRINDQRVSYCFLKDGDVIQLGGRRLVFWDPPRQLREHPGLGSESPAPRPAPPPPSYLDDGQPVSRGFLYCATGPGQGRKVTLDRPLIRLGDNSGFRAAVSWANTGLMLLNLNPSVPLVLNDNLVSTSAPLRDGDQLRLGDNLIEVHLTEPLSEQGTPLSQLRNSTDAGTAH